MNFFTLCFVICGFYNQAIFSLNKDPAVINFNNAYGKESTDRYKYNNSIQQFSSSYQPLINTDSGYGFQRVHTSSAYIPAYNKGPPIKVVPENERTDYYLVRVNKTSMDISPNKLYPSSGKYPQNILQSDNKTIIQPTKRQNRRTRLHECIKCPSEKILIAQRGLDGVLINPPKLFSCQNRVISNSAYQMETLFGSEYKFLLGQGSHSFHGRIRNKKTGKFIQTCILRYKIIVQQCGRYFPQDINVRSKCDLGYIWGSKCHFSCRTGFLNKNTPMICGDRLKWEGDKPECLSQPALIDRPTPTVCNFITVPENGRFSCEYPLHINREKYKNELVTPDGSLCRIICNRNYEIPQHLQSYSLVKCQAGRWNSTILNVCQPKTTRYLI